LEDILKKKKLRIAALLTCSSVLFSLNGASAVEVSDFGTFKDTIEQSADNPIDITINKNMNMTDDAGVNPGTAVTQANSNVNISSGNNTLNLGNTQSLLDISSDSAVKIENTSIQNANTQAININDRGELTLNAGSTINLSNNGKDIVNNGKTTITGAGTVGIGSGIQGNGLINNSGNLVLKDGSDNSGFLGTYNQSAGSLTIETNATAFTGTNTITGGALKLDNNTEFNASVGAVSSAIINGTLNLTGEANINSAYSGAGIINNTIAGNTVTLSDLSNFKGTYSQSNGITNVANNTQITGNTNFTGGNLNIGENAKLNAAIADSVSVALNNAASEVNLAGDTAINGNYSGSGKINNNGHTVTISGDNSTFTGTYTQTNSNSITEVSANAVMLGGNNTIKAGKLIYSTANDLAAGSTLSMANGTELELASGANLTADIGALSKAVINGTLNIDDSITVNSNYSGGTTGTLNSSNNTITINQNNFTGKYSQTNGTTNVNSSISNEFDINNSSLNFNKGSNWNASSKLTSNNSTVSIISNSNADTIIAAITNANSSNSNLHMIIDGSKTSGNLNIDGTNIADLTFKNAVEYNGQLTGSGAVTNTGNLTLKTGDASGYTGTFTQSGSSSKTTISENAKIFGGTINIQEGILDVTSNASDIDYSKVNLSSGTTLKHTTTLSDGTPVNISSSGIKLSDASGNNSSNVNIEFKSNGKGIYNLADKIDNGNKNTVSFTNSTVKLGSTDYKGATNYKLNNSTLDLINTKGDTSDYEFTNLSATGKNKLNITAKIVETSDPNVRAIQTDTLTIGTSGTKFDLGRVFITGEELENGQAITGIGDKGQNNYVSNAILSGASFNTGNTGTIDFNGATTAYEYALSTGQNTITLAAKAISNENSLNKINSTEGNKFFQFAVGNTKTYHIGQSLDPTKAGDFYITGRSNNADDSILSGAIVDADGNLTGQKGSLFNIANGTDSLLDITNITIQDASKTGNGSVVENNSSSANVIITNSKIKNNTATGNGGAIYNNAQPDNPDDYNLQISDTVFESNSAAGKGGAIYNAGNMKLSNVTVKAKASDTILNDIYQETNGKTLLTGNNSIYSNISGEGSITNEGNLLIAGDNSNYTGTFNQADASSKTTLKGTFFAGTSTIDGGQLNWYTDKTIPQDAVLLMNDGTLNVGNDDVVAVLSIAKNTAGDKSAIAEKAIVNINSKSSVTIDGGEVSLNDNDNWDGSIVMNSNDDSILNLNSIKKNGTIQAEKGQVNLIAGNLEIKEGSNIKDTAAANLNAGTNLIVNGGSVEVGNNDKWNSDTTLNSGSLTINGLENTGKIFANDGTLKLNDVGKLNVADGSYIKSAVKTEIQPDAQIDITNGGTVHIGDDDTWDGKISLNGGDLYYGTKHSGTLEGNSGNLHLISGSVLDIQKPSVIDNIVNVDIQKNATVNVKDGAELNLDSKDNWNGMIHNSNGYLYTDNLTNSTANGGGLQQDSGISIFDNNSHINITDANSYITGGTVQVSNNSSLYMSADTAELNIDKFIMNNNSTYNVMNDKQNTSVTDSMVVNGNNDVIIDIFARPHESDKVFINNLSSDSKGVLAVSDFEFSGLCPIDRFIDLQIFNANNISNVDLISTAPEKFTPIGWYKLEGRGGGAYTAMLTRYNPQVFRGQVATLAMYNNQLIVDDIVTNHFILHSDRLINKAKNANKYSAISPLFAPYQKTYEEGGIWSKSYASLDRMSLTQHLSVGNNVYGTIVGADLPAIELKNNWKFIPTGYIGYMGGHQTFNGMSMYQNGGQLGAMGTFIKNDFIGSATAFGGGYLNDMSITSHSRYGSHKDDNANWFAGASAKAAYNFHPAKDFTIQPTMMLAYNAFGKQNWNTDFGIMSMQTGMMNGVNAAPGLNFILEKDTWSLYATTQYMYFINDKVDGYAGNVHLPNVRMRHGYFQYGIGATKTWKDRLASYTQVNIRNGGVTGIGFQLGFQYLFDIKEIKWPWKKQSK